MLVMLILLSTAAAVEPAPAADNPINQKLKESDTPWNFSCGGDTKSTGKKEHRSVCRGKVAITHDDLKINCDLMEAQHDDKWGVKKVTCLENVVINSSQGRATAEKAEYDYQSQDVVLTGNPVLYQGGSVIHGQIIRYNLKDESFNVSKMTAVIDNHAVKNAPASQPASRPAKK